MCAAALGIFTLLTLVLLYDSPRQEVGEGDGEEKGAGAVARPSPAPSLRRVPPSAAGRLATPARPAASPLPDMARNQPPTGRPPVSVRQIAPPSEPLEISAEKDPERRAQLKQMHELAMARVRAGLFRRRARMLQDSLQQARKQGTWSAEQIRQAETQLLELEQAIDKAQQKAEGLRQRVGVEEDPGR